MESLKRYFDREDREGMGKGLDEKRFVSIFGEVLGEDGHDIRVRMYVCVYVCICVRTQAYMYICI